jgi:hypothetical protein
VEAQRILEMLPGVFQAPAALGQPQGVMAGLLGAMEALHERPETVVGDLPAWFALERAPDEALAYLATWLDLGWLVGWEDEDSDGLALPGGAPALRLLLMTASELSARQGTAEAMRTFLDVATGVPGFEVEDVGGFTIRVTVPAAAVPFEGTVRRIVEQTKPAHVSYQVVLGPDGQETGG